MTRKTLDWCGGAELEDHSRRKHAILRQYYYDYLMVRCQLPQRSRFRHAVIDGFAGGGRYRCGSAGSPVIFLEELTRAVEAVNLRRGEQKAGPIEIECLLVLNDTSRDAIDRLKETITPLQAAIKQTAPAVRLSVEIFNQPFETLYPKLGEMLHQRRFRSVLFNLDQYGDIDVNQRTISDIMGRFVAPEVFHTLGIQSLVSFLRKGDRGALKERLKHLGLSETDLDALDGPMNRQAWLGAAEKLVFDAFERCAPFVSPFSIHNPNGWRYWLIHFAKAYRARDILHQNSTMQAHYGRSGLEMLSYNPAVETGTLYLFDAAGRALAKNQLMEDIPRMIRDTGDAMPVAEFYEGIYNATPAHSDDIHAGLIDNPDLDVVTQTGGQRRKANTIKIDDTIRLKQQRSFFSILRPKQEN